MPTPVPDAARRHYLVQKAITASVVARIRAVWARIDAGDLDVSWVAEQARMVAVLVSGLAIAASQADTYLDAILTELGINPDRTATVVAAAFAGTASDGRPITSLLYEPVISTKVALGAGLGATQALASGEAALMRIAATQMQDAGRMSVGVGIAARPAVTSYTRMLSPPSCARCAVLAGRVYRWNSGFQRHPHCDCRHIPSIENVAGDLTTNPDAYFRSLSTADQDRYFTKAGAETIRQGGDISQVVNARRGMYQANGMTFTRVGSRRVVGGRRLMPETILEQAGNDREFAVTLLREHGYLN